MGLAAELSYTYRRPNVFHRLVQAFASTRGGACFFSKTLAPIDRAAAKVSNDRFALPTLLARLPVLVLTSTGRKSGQPRQTHLIAVPFRDTLAVLGTNFGQPQTPAWVLNLEAHPQATVTHKDVSRPVQARPATDDEQAEILSISRKFYGGYAKYQERISGRALRIFVLEPAA